MTGYDSKNRGSNPEGNNPRLIQEDKEGQFDIGPVGIETTPVIPNQQPVREQYAPYSDQLLIKSIEEGNFGLAQTILKDFILKKGQLETLIAVTELLHKETMKELEEVEKSALDQKSKNEKVIKLYELIVKYDLIAQLLKDQPTKPPES